MAIVRWEPFRELVNTQREFNRLFGDRFKGFLGDEELSTRTWAPPVDIYENENNLVLKADLPGVDPKDAQVSLMDNILTVKGERKANQDTTGTDYFVREVAYGAFQRSFELPEGVDAAQVEAKHANGMLDVRVPAPRAATPRMIEVKAA